MEQFLRESSEYILTFAGAVTVIVVGVMSILLPILVFMISWKTSRINKKLNKALALLAEQVKLAQKIEENTGKTAENCQPSLAAPVTHNGEEGEEK